MDELHRTTVELGHTVEVLRAELQRVRAAFEAYARHLGNCEIERSNSCTCGFIGIRRSVDTGEWSDNHAS